MDIQKQKRVRSLLGTLATAFFTALALAVTPLTAVAGETESGFDPATYKPEIISQVTEGDTTTITLNTGTKIQYEVQPEGDSGCDDGTDPSNADATRSVVAKEGSDDPIYCTNAVIRQDCWNSNGQRVCATYLFLNQADQRAINAGYIAALTAVICAVSVPLCAVAAVMLAVAGSYLDSYGLCPSSRPYLRVRTATPYPRTCVVNTYTFP
jgi:hypothetical protein